MRINIIVLCSMITGCAQPQYIVRSQEDSNRAYTAALAAQCEAIGYKRDTDALRNCMLTLHGQNQQEAVQMRGIAAQEALRRQYQQMPLCSSLPPGLSGMARAQGNCR